MIIIRTMHGSLSIGHAPAVGTAPPGLVAVMCTVLRVELLLRVTAARCLPTSAAALSLCTCNASVPLRHCKVCTIVQERSAPIMCTHVT